MNNAKEITDEERARLEEEAQELSTPAWEKKWDIPRSAFRSAGVNRPNFADSCGVTVSEEFLKPENIEACGDGTVKVGGGKTTVGVPSKYLDNEDLIFIYDRDDDPRRPARYTLRDLSNGATNKVIIDEDLLKVMLEVYERAQAMSERLKVIVDESRPRHADV